MFDYSTQYFIEMIEVAEDVYTPPATSINEIPIKELKQAHSVITSFSRDGW